MTTPDGGQRRGHAVRALLLARNDKWHREEELAKGWIEPWLREMGLEVTRTNDRSLWTAETLTHYDLFLPWLIPGDTTTPAEVEALRGFVYGGGLVFGFHGTTIVPDTAEMLPYIELWGARFTGHPKYQEFPVRVVDPEHAITRGLSDFRVSDELYQHNQAPAGATVLLDTVWEGTTHALAWEKVAGRGALYYLALGHDEAAWNHPAFKHLVIQGTRWLLTHA